MRRILCLGGLMVAIGSIVMAQTTRSVLVPQAGGGWRTQGLPYEAVITPEGYVTSLRVGDFECLSVQSNGPRGLYLAEGKTRLPYAEVGVEGDALVAANPQAKVRVRFLPDRLMIRIANHSIANGHCLRMDLSTQWTRINAAGQGLEYDVPLRTTVRTPARLVGPNGASLTLGESRSYNLNARGTVASTGHAYEHQFPWVPISAGGHFDVVIDRVPRPEDRVKVKVSLDADDYTFWSDAPQPLTATVINVDPNQPLKADLLLRMRSYLTKQVAAELPHPIALKGGETQTLNWTLKDFEPMLYIAEVWVRVDGVEGLCTAPRLVFNAAGMQPPEPPDDFDAFWESTLAEQAAIPLDLKIEKVKDQGDHEVYNFSFAGLLGYRCYGWLTLPLDKSHKWPAVLVLPPAGNRPQPIPIFKDAVGMRININTSDVDLKPEEYDVHTWPAQYLVTGILDRDHYCLRFGYASLVRAAEVLAARPDVDPDQIRVEGSSQGGGLTLIAAGLHPHFTSASAKVPGLCRLDWNVDYLNPPFFPIGVNDYTRDAITETLRYFLPSHFARKIRCPITITCGLHDDVTPSAGVFCAYNAIPGTNKTMMVKPNAGH